MLDVVVVPATVPAKALAMVAVAFPVAFPVAVPVAVRLRLWLGGPGLGLGDGCIQSRQSFHYSYTDCGFVLRCADEVEVEVKVSLGMQPARA